MPYALIAIGVAMVVTGVQNTYAALGTQLQSDGVAFLKWGVAIGIVGAGGYVSDLQGLSRAFLGLILIAMVLSNTKTGSGFLGNLLNAINAGPATTGKSAISGAAGSTGTSTPSITVTPYTGPMGQGGAELGAIFGG